MLPPIWILGEIEGPGITLSVIWIIGLRSYHYSNSLSLFWIFKYILIVGIWLGSLATTIFQILFWRPQRDLWHQVKIFKVMSSLDGWRNNKKKFFLSWDGPYVVLEKNSDVHYKISKTGSSNKWQIVHYNRLRARERWAGSTQGLHSTCTRKTTANWRSSRRLAGNSKSGTFLGKHYTKDFFVKTKKHLETSRDTDGWRKKMTSSTISLRNRRKLLRSDKKQTKRCRTLRKYRPLNRRDLMREGEREREHDRSKPGTPSPKCRASGPTRDNGSTKQFSG